MDMQLVTVGATVALAVFLPLRLYSVMTAAIKQSAGE